MKQISVLSLIASLASALLGIYSTSSVADAANRIYYIRHGEGGHNVKQDWIGSGIPEEEWPDYVGDANQFTPLGLEQVALVSAQLQELVPGGFDVIGSSPLWRSRNTILPYMREIGATGKVWPELKEQSVRSADVLRTDLPVITDPILGEGSLLSLPDDETDWLSFRSDGRYDFRIPSYAAEENEEEWKTAAKIVVYKAAISLMEDYFEGKEDQNILLAGHGGSGKALMQLLSNDTNWWGIENTGIWVVEQQADGTFKPLMYNSVSLIPDPGLVQFSDLRADLSGGRINGENADDSAVSITRTADGQDMVYSLSIVDQDLDGDGDSDDSLSWDIRFKCFTGSSATLDGNDSSVSLGSSEQVYTTDSYFGVLDGKHVSVGESIQFSVENVVLNAADGAKVRFNGFDGLWGTDDSYIFGVGPSGLESLVTTSDASFTFNPMTELTLTCPVGLFRVSQLSGSFMVIAGTATPLVGAWPLDDGSGAVASDVSGNGYDGTVIDGSWVDGVVGGALDFNGSSTRMDIPATAFTSIYDEITIAMWVYGDASQPRQNSVFYATDGSGNRILNIHLPWSNSTVYWDAGDSSGYDRIDKVANADDFKGQWNHWTFTKNATTGEMTIYLNGAVWHTDTGKFKTMSSIRSATLGSQMSSANYDGTIDDVRLYNVALTAPEVAMLYSGESIPSIVAWFTNYPSLANTSFDGDPDNDGIATGLEYVLNGDPTAAGDVILPEMDATGEHFVFSFRRLVSSAEDTTQVFQYSSTLQSDDWTDLSITDSTAAEVTLGSEVDGIQTVTVMISKSIATGAKLFGRLKVAYL